LEREKGEIDGDKIEDGCASCFPIGKENREEMRRC
jgi:hypothetical protein